MSKESTHINRVSFIGSGSWASALAIIAAKNAKEVIIHTRSNNITNEINDFKTNKGHIGDIVLNDNISAETGYSTLSQSQLIVIVTPVSSLIEIKQLLVSLNLNEQLILICSKGIDSNSLLFPTELLTGVISNNRLAVLSGPNFAKEVASLKIAKTAIASSNLNIAKSISNIFQTESFYPIISSDIIGVQICGALKNVIAIAVGISRGLDLGENFSAALISDGLKEISKLIEVCGGDMQTAYEIAGIGDLVLTCGSLTSRNVSFGYKFAKNKHQGSSSITVEGANTTLALNKLSSRLDIDLPISKVVHQIIYENKPPSDFLKLYLGHKVE